MKLKAESLNDLVLLSIRRFGIPLLEELSSVENVVVKPLKHASFGHNMAIVTLEYKTAPDLPSISFQFNISQFVIKNGWFNKDKYFLISCQENEMSNRFTSGRLSSCQEILVDKFIESPEETQKIIIQGLFSSCFNEAIAEWSEQMKSLKYG